MAKGAACLNVSYKGHVNAFNEDYKEIASHFMWHPLCVQLPSQDFITHQKKTFCIDALFEVVSTSKQ